MKVYTLNIHTKSYSDADLVLNPKEHSDANLGDIVEIFDRDSNKNSRLVLQITKFSDLKKRDVISVDSAVASQFNLRAFTDVVMRVVNAHDVALDSVEIVFKDQYMGRSDMWRLKTYLTNTCIYVNKKIAYHDLKIRCQFHELWAQGDRVSCGVITEETKLVFRSCTSMVYLFIQMSSEMWDYDIHGNLYFEKAVNGFLSELFEKWNRMDCNHDVTIVLFSRTFYEATTLEEFPADMHDSLQIDYKGRFYEDFYKVAVQNERFDDWCTVLSLLKKHFTTYLSTVLKSQHHDGANIPPAYNSTALQGNFLEVLNISLNTFGNHYMDRKFDRTGQLSVVITPGVGVFEVDRELCNITKQRIIDDGIGSDLVCVGEQPLHAVPLLIFHNKDTFTITDDYSLPHWINLSYYTTNKKIAYSNYLPRIKLPLDIVTALEKYRNNTTEKLFPDCNQSEYLHSSLFDYDAYDDQIFQQMPATAICFVQPTSQTPVENTSTLSIDANSLKTHKKYRNRKMSDPEIHYCKNESCFQPVLRKRSKSLLLLQRKAHSEHSTMSLRGRALINPFDPSHVTIKLTSNRRRWTHIFPKDPTGLLIQQHHYQALPAKTHPINDINISSNFKQKDMFFFNNEQTGIKNKKQTNIVSKFNVLMPSNYLSTMTAAKSFLWGATGEQVWTPAIVTGVDWKSLTIPACLPLTTDFFPDKRSLHNDYVISDYALLPDDINVDYTNSCAVNRKPLSAKEVCKEMVSQRLAQGFQLVMLEEKSVNSNIKTQKKSFSPIKPRETENKEEFLLSIGRIFHKISLTTSVITVTGYRPRHPYLPKTVDYRYRFYAPYHKRYEVCRVNFATEKLENFNWNYMDHYICTRGDTTYPLIETLKYWRYRMFLLPKENLAMNKITESRCDRFDIFTDVVLDNSKLLVDDFIRLLEQHFNKLKRQQCHKPRENQTTQTHLTRRRHSTSIICRPPTNQTKNSSPFRERVGSNRLPEKRPSLTVDTKLPPNIAIIDLIEAMKHPESGLSFYASSSGLPSKSFTSYDALLWLQNHLDDDRNPLEILQLMHKEKLICHASADWSKPVIPGFYIYFIVQNGEQDKESVQPMFICHTFENEWIEVKLHGCSYLWSTGSTAVHSSELLQIDSESPSWPEQFNERNIYRHAHLEVHTSHKRDRSEWGHIRYHKVMQPGFAFEIVVEWVTASGLLVWDLISGWSRRANQYGYQLVPVPADPMAEQLTNKSDPLRRPIFVPLCSNFLSENGLISQDLPAHLLREHLLPFQDAILKRFGFLPCDWESGNFNEKLASRGHRYIHCSGYVFALSWCSKNSYIQDVTQSEESSVSYINIGEKAGFLWAWNHMIPNKKWKSNILKNSQDGELFQIKMLKDFRKFCSNSDQRLYKFWESFHQSAT